MFKRRFLLRAQLLFILMALFLLSNATAAQTDNCCSVDRQCATINEWVSGYYAFRNSECGAPSQQQQAQQAQQDQSPAQSNNCCFNGWQCAAEQEWISGYFAFQRDHCVSHSLENGYLYNGNQQRQVQPQSEALQTSYSRNYQHSSQETDGAETYYESKRYTTLEDDTPVGIVVLSSWGAFWRAYCRTYTHESNRPECR